MIVGAHHYGIGVTDVERCTNFYRDILGFRVVRRRSGNFGQVAAVAGHPGLEWKMVWLRLGDLIIELLEPSPRDENRLFPWPAGLGYHHIALRVTDLESVHADLVGKGVEFHVPPRTSPEGIRGAFAKDPEGNVIEFFQTPEGIETPE